MDVPLSYDYRGHPGGHSAGGGDRAFAAMSGSGLSGALTVGIVAIPALLARGYDKKLAIVNSGSYAGDSSSLNDGKFTGVGRFLPEDLQCITEVRLAT